MFALWCVEFQWLSLIERKYILVILICLSKYHRSVSTGTIYGDLI
jgi:hypothetical protein